MRRNVIREAVPCQTRRRSLQVLQFASCKQPSITFPCQIYMPEQDLSLTTTGAAACRQLTEWQSAPQRPPTVSMTAALTRDVQSRDVQSRDGQSKRSNRRTNSDVVARRIRAVQKAVCGPMLREQCGQPPAY